MPIQDEITCDKCNCEILEEHKDLSCHAHNTKNTWRRFGMGEQHEVFRTLVIDEKRDEDETE